MRLLLLLACLGAVACATVPIMTPTDIDTCSNSSKWARVGRNGLPARLFLSCIGAQCLMGSGTTVYVVPRHRKSNTERPVFLLQRPTRHHRSLASRRAPALQ